MKKQKICIIGGGLTGLVASLILCKSGINVDLFVGNKANNTSQLTNGRSIGISKSSYGFLLNHDFFNKFIKNMWPINEIKIYQNSNSNIKEILNFKKKQLMYMINYSPFIKFLQKEAFSEKLINFKKINLSPKKILNIINTKNKDFYNLILNCTGSKSLIMKENNKNSVLHNASYETAFSTILKHNLIKQNNVARQIFLKEGPLALLPISNKETALVWSVNNKFLKKNNKEKIFFFKNQISKKLKFFFKNYYIGKIKFTSIKFDIANKYYYKRALNLGDSLHQIHPFMGQGFNMTLRDLKELNNIIKDKINLGLDIGDELTMIKFEKSRKSQNFIFSIGSNFIKNFFDYDNKIFKIFANQALLKVNKNKGIKNFFINSADRGLIF